MPFGIDNQYLKGVKNMARHKLSGPTERELAILGILWNNGPSTVRRVNEEMNKQQRTGYTTTLKLMQIMTEKGLLIRDDSKFQHVAIGVSLCIVAMGLLLLASHCLDHDGALLARILRDDSQRGGEGACQDLSAQLLVALEAISHLLYCWDGS